MRVSESFHVDEPLKIGFEDQNVKPQSVGENSFKIIKKKDRGKMTKKKICGSST